MRTPKINSKKLAAALAPIALAGAVMAPAAAASPPASSHGVAATAMRSKVGSSRGFHIYNLTSHPIQLENITGGGHFEGRPNDGDVLNPGYYHDVEVQSRWPSEEWDTAHYTWRVDDGGGNWHMAYLDVPMHVPAWSKPTSSCNTWSGSGESCTAGDTTITLLDPPGTVHNLSPDQQQQQADVLNQLCNAGVASCKFTATNEAHTLGEDRVVGEAAENPGDFDMHTSIDASDKVGESDSVGVELSAGIEGVVIAEVTAKYEHEWTHEHEFSQSFDVKVPPHSKVWFTHQAPTLRDTGDFTVTLGNTTWNLTGVYFDTPDITDQHQTGQYTPHCSGSCVNWTKADTIPSRPQS
jgi:hypothetical protein